MCIRLAGASIYNCRKRLLIVVVVSRFKFIYFAWCQWGRAAAVDELVNQAKSKYTAVKSVKCCPAFKFNLNVCVELFMEGHADTIWGSSMC